MRTSPCPATSGAARSAALPLPMMRKSARSSKRLLMLLSYHRPNTMPSSRRPRTEPVRLDVRTSTGHYTIEIADGAATRLGATLDAAGVPTRRFIVSSPTVWRFHGDGLRYATAEEPILIPDGERGGRRAAGGRGGDARV